MCRSTEKEHLPPTAVRADSTLSTAANSILEASDSWSSSDEGTPRGQEPMQLIKKNYERNSDFSYVFSPAVSVIAGTLTAVAVTAFALSFPFWLSPHAASKTYHWAFYNYDPALSHFDNTIWTFGTDYGLAVWMALLAGWTLRFSTFRVTDSLCARSAALLVCYCLSVAAGGYCHHFYLTLESRNSTSFQLLWTLCVGTVTFASTFMGMAGTECLRRFRSSQPLLQKVPLVPDSFWWTFGICNTLVVAAGGMSFQRPACDIFIAGITQFPSTFYVMTCLTLVNHQHLQEWKCKLCGNVGFILNAPLLPMYPLLVQYTDWSLAGVNTLLHSCLCLAWTIQGGTLLHLIQALLRERGLVEATSRKDQ